MFQNTWIKLIWEQTHGYSLGGNASISMTSQSDPWNTPSLSIYVSCQVLKQFKEISLSIH